MPWAVSVFATKLVLGCGQITPKGSSVGCRIIALKSQDYTGPPYTQSQVAHVIRDAHIECGHKGITFTTLTAKDDESLNITEEIDAKSILQRP